MKKIISMLLVCAMLLSLCVFTASAEDVYVLANGTAEIPESETFTYEWVATDNGKLTVNMGAASPGWRVYFISGTGDFAEYSIPTTADFEMSVTHNVMNGETYTVVMMGYDVNTDMDAAVSVSYEITFTPGELEVVKEEYEVCYDMMLNLGANEVILSPNATTTVYEFCPDEAGVYLFESSDENALLSYWGNNSSFVWNFTEAPTTALEQTLEEVGPSIMVGVTGVESCTINVTKLGTVDVGPSYEDIDYVNTTDVIPYTLPEGVNPTSNVNVTDANEDAAVLGNDGYFHLNAEDGPVLFVNLGPSAPYGSPFSAAAAYGATKGCYFDEEGNLTAIVNYVPAWTEYRDNSDNNLYPLTEDLITMYTHVGENLGWYDKDSIFEAYLFGNADVNPATAWMFNCCYDRNYTGNTAVDETVKYTVNSVYNECTNTIDVTIAMDNNVLGLWASVMFLDYNDEILTIIEDSIMNGDVWNEKSAFVDVSHIGEHNYDWANNVVYLSFFGNNTVNAATSVSGTVATFSFEVKDGVDIETADLGFELKTWNKAPVWAHQEKNHIRIDENETSGIPVEFEVNYTDTAIKEHTLVIIPAVEATCKEAGNTEGVKCEVCEAIIVAPEVIPAGKGVTYYPAVEATCHTAGNYEYWYCEDCDVYYGDAELTVVTNIKNLTIPSTSLVFYEEVPACHEYGVKAYWFCEGCGMCFADPEGKINVDWWADLMIYPTVELTYVEFVEAGCHTTGNNEYWYCEVCDECYIDADGKFGTNRFIQTRYGTAIEHFEAVEATCHQNGTQEYWYCTECDAYFADYACTQQTNLKNLTVLPANELTYVAASEATCHVNGNSEYWYCAECDTLFADAAGQVITNRKNVVVPATSVEYYAAVEPGCHQTGMQEYWYCKDCDAVFADNECKIITNRKNLTVAALNELVYSAPVAATTTSTGSYEYWYCPECDAVFADAAGIQLTNRLNLTIPILTEFKATVNGVEANYEAGAIVTLKTDMLIYDAAENKGYVFVCWVAEGVGFEDPTALETTFVMPAFNVVITEKRVLHGDVNSDEKITAADVLTLLSAIKDGNVEGVQFDVNLDGKVTAADKLVLGQIVKGSYNYEIAE